ncbi:cell wall hydrolase [Sphingomonas sp. PP-CC-3A-396]|uniref:cell wall hydrolase n=1 Tax=Sphingomonas sp. PP-CC-3A-396 TaxID=2135655 RepID=UPI001043BBD1|nr:cell wall hydrolase [Sphingomonas sp. PP-CC-3A-396]TCQ03025.1 cell wall hydrolase [Sphingomonas sp. PP-CC-3A-396]
MELGSLSLHWMRIRARPELLGIVVLGAMAMLFAIGVAIFLTVVNRPTVSRIVPPPPVVATTGPVAHPDAPVQLDDAMTEALLQPLQAQPMTRDQAIAYNATVPMSTEPNPAAAIFQLGKATPVDIQRATDCLTAAIYFEAALEPASGQRAVAQVVLNRVRHFAFPKTVCGVVFQGSDRPTGCQFTFTCDGAMSKKIDNDLWERARVNALAALGGHVEPRIGHATHYHAIYVAPYWQPSLLKVAAVGLHIFYRGIGAWGLPPSFTARYAGGEPDIAAMAMVVPAPVLPPPLVMPSTIVTVPMPSTVSDQMSIREPQSITPDPASTRLPIPEPSKVTPPPSQDAKSKKPVFVVPRPPMTRRLPL